jgi:hypothetical protein
MEQARDQEPDTRRAEPDDDELQSRSFSSRP